MKYCNHCGTELKGNQERWCKGLCQTRWWRENNREKDREISREYYKTHKEIHYKRTRSWERRNRETYLKAKRKNWKKRYYNDEKFRQDELNQRKNERKKFPSHGNARSVARRKVTIKETDACLKCGSKEHLERHHPDYTKPLEVEILCRKCHKSIGSYRVTEETKHLKLSEQPYS